MQRADIVCDMLSVPLAALGVLKLDRTKNRCIFKMQPQNTSDQRDSFIFETWYVSCIKFRHESLLSDIPFSIFSLSFKIKEK